MIFKENYELHKALESRFVYRNEKQLLYERLMAAHLGLSGLIAFWNMANIDASNNGDVWSSSGGDKTLSNVNTVTFNNDGILPYAQITNSSTNYLERADEASLDISGNETYIDSSIRGLTMGGMFYFDSSTGSNQALIHKRSLGDISYFINYTTGGKVQFGINDGVSGDSVSHPDNLALNTWYHVVARYDRTATQISICLNGSIQTSNTTLTSIKNSAVPLRIGSRSDGALYMDGRATNCFLCASSIDEAQIAYLSNLSLELVR